MSRVDPPSILLTGATGLVGGGLLGQLLVTRPGCSITALSRYPDAVSRLAPGPAVNVVQADITCPRLGLGEDAWAALQSSVTEIIHCAADTRFGLALDQARLTNTEGTRTILDLARGCKRLQKFAHISTVFVVGRTPGWHREVPAPAVVRSGFSNTYQQSKYEAEGLVLEAMREIPAAIFRLSSIIGDSTSGRVRQYNYVHQLLRVFPRNVLPMVPGDPAAPIDLIASDWVSQALGFLIERSFTPGRVYHVCAGPEESLSVQQLIDQTREEFANHPQGRRWLPIPVPTLVSLAEYEDFVERSQRGDDILLKELLRVLEYFLPHLGIFQAFDNSNTRDGLSTSGLHMPPIRSYFSRVVRFCLDNNWRVEAVSEN